MRNFNKRNVHPRFIGNIWAANLADMQLINILIIDLDFYYVLLIFIVNTGA